MENRSGKIKEIRFLGSGMDEEIKQLQSALQKVEVVVQKTESVDNLLPEQGILWITDEAICAQKLLQAGEAVLFYLNAQKKQDTSGVMYCIEGFEEIDISYLEQVYCRLKKLPWQVLETERLLLREIEVEDVARLYELYADAEITRYMEGLFASPEEERDYTEQYIQNIYGFYGYGMWVIVQKESGEVIGRAGIENREGFEGVELGFMLGKNYQHRGYAGEICQAILDYVTEYFAIEDYYALVMPENKASKRLLQKLGFRETGLQQNGDVIYEVFSLHKNH